MNFNRPRFQKQINILKKNGPIMFDRINYKVEFK